MKVEILLIFATFLEFSNSEYFSSTEELKNLNYFDEKFISWLRDFSNELDKKNALVKRKLQEYEYEHALMKKDLDGYIFNPLNAFSLIKRLSYDIESMKDEYNFIPDFLRKIKRIKIPLEELTGAVEGIYRLQYTYDLKSEHLAKGIVQNKRYRMEMRPSEILVLAKEMKKFDEKLSLEYIKVAKELNAKSNPTSKIEFLEELFGFYNSSSKYKEAVEVLDEIFEIDANKSKYEEQRMNVELLSLFTDHKEPEKPRETRENSGSHYTEKKEGMIFSKACNGKLKKSKEEMSKLHCRYVSTTDFTKIAPFKVIEANLDPFVGIYLDVISDKEIEVLKSFASKELFRAEVMVVNKTSTATKIRIAQLCWLEDRLHKTFDTLTRRVGDMTGLDMYYSEKWQVQNYGIGGFYAAHHDYAAVGQQFTIDDGNRIATTLFYISDVEKGGGTVFPLLRIYVPPIKGSAAFWYNLSTSGDREVLTRHAACPVIVGSKWVANKWIREHGQEMKRPCEKVPKVPDEKYYLKMYDLKDYGIHV